MKEGAAMPEPMAGESRDEYATRCIPEVLKEDVNLSSGQAAGKCFGMYDSWKENKGKPEE